MAEMPDCPDYGRYARSRPADGVDRCDHCGRVAPVVVLDGQTGALVMVGPHKPRCNACERERDLWFVEFRAAGSWYRTVLCREHLLRDEVWLLDQRGSVERLDPDAPPLSATRTPSAGV